MVSISLADWPANAGGDDADFAGEVDDLRDQDHGAHLAA
jgi:hypothetical protein